MGIHPGINAIKSQLRSDMKRVNTAKKRAMQNTKEARKARKRSKASLEHQQMDQEGIM
ncbi:hypothetical protein X975_01786, partial [Stegodyphus mimosarum]